jgi:N-acetyl-1-D-myo-inositol-2-amino-2-deoxy-alpha-D-glucopyranoside deacetylase
LERNTKLIMETTHPKTLLAVLAHPDDESFGTGGTLAYYARQGAQVYLVCATRGEVGEMDARFMEGYHSIAERREDELRCAARTLGLSEVFFLDYRDSGMPGSPDNRHLQALVAQPQAQVAAAIVHYLRKLRPQVVITFDPIGGYHHPDHIAIHNATVQAFHDAALDQDFGDGLAPFQAQRLYFHTMPRGFLRWMVRLMPLLGRDPHKFGQNGDIDLAAIAAVDFPTNALIDYRAVFEVRDQAAACHASQNGASIGGRGLTGWLRKTFAAHEQYMRAYPPVQPDEKVSHDLFQGVTP